MKKEEIIFEILKLIVQIAPLVWAIITGFKTFRNYANDKRTEQLSKYIKEFSKQDRMYRLSGMSGLTYYASDMFMELFYICVLEKDALIKEIIKDALMRICPQKKSECLQLHTFFVKYILRQNVKLSKISYLENKKYFYKTLKKGNTENRIHMEINRIESSTSLDEEVKVDEYLILSSELLALSMKKAKKQDLSGILFLESNLYGCIWNKCYIKNTALIESVGRHAKGYRNHLENVYINDCNFYGSRFIEMRCNSIYMYNKTHFRDSIMAFCSIKGKKYEDTNQKLKSTGGPANENKKLEQRNYSTVIKSAIFSESTFFKVEIKWYQIEQGYWNGCRLFFCKFKEVDLIANKWNGTNYVNCSFTHLNFNKDIIKGNFKYCKFQDINWKDSELKETIFVGCKFKNVDFANADLEKVLFDHCTLEGDINFKNVKNKESIRKKGAKTKAYIKKALAKDNEHQL